MNTKLLLIGNFGAGNYGDEAILIAFLRRMFNDFDDGFEPLDFCVVTADEAVTRAFLTPFLSAEEMARITFVKPLPFGVRSFFRTDIRKTIGLYKACGAAIYCGGGLFTDEESRLSVPMWASYGLLMNRLGKPIFGYGLGFGEIRRLASRFLLQRLAPKFSFLGVRDENSAMIASSFSGVPVVTGDTFLLFTMPENETVTVQRKNTIVISLRPWKKTMQNSYRKIARSLDAVIEKFGLRIEFLPFQRAGQNDAEIMNKIIEHSSHKEHIFVSSRTTDLRSVFEKIRSAKAVIGMRFHACLFAKALKVPLVAVPYSMKGRSLVSDFGGACFLEINELEDSGKVVSAVGRAIVGGGAYLASVSSVEILDRFKSSLKRAIK